MYCVCKYWTPWSVLNMGETQRRVDRKTSLCLYAWMHACAILDALERLKHRGGGLQKDPFVYGCACVCKYLEVLDALGRGRAQRWLDKRLVHVTLNLFLQPETTATFGSIHRPCHSNYEYIHIYASVYRYWTHHSHFHNDWFFLAKKKIYSGTQRCRKISNRCISVTESNVEFFFQAKKKAIIMKMRVERLKHAED